MFNIVSDFKEIKDISIKILNDLGKVIDNTQLSIDKIGEDKTNRTDCLNKFKQIKALCLEYETMKGYEKDVLDGSAVISTSYGFDPGKVGSFSDIDDIYNAGFLKSGNKFYTQEFDIFNPNFFDVFNDSPKIYFDIPTLPETVYVFSVADLDADFSPNYEEDYLRKIESLNTLLAGQAGTFFDTISASYYIPLNQTFTNTYLPVPSDSRTSQGTTLPNVNKFLVGKYVKLSNGTNYIIAQIKGRTVITIPGDPNEYYLNLKLWEIGRTFTGSFSYPLDITEVIPAADVNVNTVLEAILPVYKAKLAALKAIIEGYSGFDVSLTNSSSSLMVMTNLITTWEGAKTGPNLAAIVSYITTRRAFLTSRWATISNTLSGSIINEYTTLVKARINKTGGTLMDIYKFSTSSNVGDKTNTTKLELITNYLTNKLVVKKIAKDGDGERIVYVNLSIDTIENTFFLKKGDNILLLGDSSTEPEIVTILESIPYSLDGPVDSNGTPTKIAVKKLVVNKKLSKTLTKADNARAVLLK